jgi:hypothetical protein
MTVIRLGNIGNIRKGFSAERFNQHNRLNPTLQVETFEKHALM